MRTLIRVGSDHSPIFLDDGVDSALRVRMFRFEKAWLLNPEFKNKMFEKWPVREDEGVESPLMSPRGGVNRRF